VAEGPGTTSVDAPPVPPFAENISFHSPLLTAVATGKYANERILTAASQIYGEQHFRAILQVEGQPAIAAVFDGVVEGNVLQLVAIFTVNDKSELEEIRIFSRPWPVTAYFRKGCMGCSTTSSAPSSGKVRTLKLRCQSAKYRPAPAGGPDCQAGRRRDPRRRGDSRHR
jgi:hypothetical protein